MAKGHDYNPNCGCPGCQFMWQGLECFRLHGPAPLIGSFKPINGDVARDIDTPTSPIRVWTGSRWHPSFEAFPYQGNAPDPNGDTLATVPVKLSAFGETV